MPPQQDPVEPSFRDAVRDLLAALEAAGHLALPGFSRDLLESVVEAAARIFGAAAASIALVDEPSGGLHIVVAYGAGRETVVGMHLPRGQGIAGYVAMTGEPLAVSDVERDPRFAQQFAQGTGYVPRSILATPLLAHERIIGVMEVLDKIEAPSFGLRDMELLALFAGQASLAIDQARQMESLSQALVLGLQQRLSPPDRAEHAPALAELGHLASSELEHAAGAEELQALAEALRALGSLGESERQLMFGLVEATARYAQTQGRRRRHR